MHFWRNEIWSRKNLQVYQQYLKIWKFIKHQDTIFNWPNVSWLHLFITYLYVTLKKHSPPFDFSSRPVRTMKAEPEFALSWRSGPAFSLVPAVRMSLQFITKCLSSIFTVTQSINCLDIASTYMFTVLKPIELLLQNTPRKCFVSSPPAHLNPPVFFHAHEQLVNTWNRLIQSKLASIANSTTAKRSYLTIARSGERTELPS